ncbi:hypothetical protein AC578_2760 [Pseudocercospora eumusae]|uniref:DUF6594 domain-containing protein n=1 Tax=Pseudocercospora eumusae TaxID=321146 RepID=A0A139HGU4_9PEZI|nr:hypothetical protein AC578_2760 [Pseudocercospora eumusae]
MSQGLPACIHPTVPAHQVLHGRARNENEALPPPAHAPPLATFSRASRKSQVAFLVPLRAYLILPTPHPGVTQASRREAREVLAPEPASPAGRASQRTPPRLNLSRPEDLDAGKPTTARKRSKTESAVKENGQPASVQWVDIEANTPRRRSKRSNHGTGTPTQGQRSRRSTESEVGGFFPKLARILESGDSSVISRPNSRATAPRHRLEGGSERRSPRKDGSASSQRRPVKHKVGALSRRRTDPLPRFNPSLLSVLSSLTRNSDRSSSSNTTITQQSYDQHHVEYTKAKATRKHSESDIKATKKDYSPHALDVMDANSVDGSHDGRSIDTESSSSSQYEPSDAGSSDLPETPSSHSTFPSPTATRSGSLNGSVGSVAELRRKYDQHFNNTSPCSTRSNSYSPEAIPRNLRKLPKINDVAEDEEQSRQPSPPYNEVVYNARKRSSSQASDLPERYEERLRQQQDELRHHVAHTQNQHGQNYVDPAHAQHRSHSTSSNGSARAQREWQHLLAMQQYQYPLPPAQMAYPPPPQTTNGHIAHPDRPPVPDAPDSSQVTIAGYEMLARELTNDSSSVKPMYRKFSYLNHRILLHLQDELQELEERLRIVDEIVAQLDHSSEQTTPASRRGDAAFGGDWHHQRTLLLGRIFQKTEQYNRALKSFQDLGSADQTSPEPEQVETYREWLKQKTPIHEVETKFLDHEHDLLLPGRTPPPPSSPPPPPNKAQMLFTYLPVGLMLPLLLFSVIPTLAGRLIVTFLISVAAVLVSATTTKIRDLMPLNEWAVCASVYVLIMAAIAGVIPRHATTSTSGSC